MGEGKITPLTTPTPLNRQSRNIAYVIMSTISPHKPHLVKIAPGPGYFSPYSQSYHSIFFISSLYAKSLHGPIELRPLNLFCHAIHQQTRTHAGYPVVPFGGYKTIFSHLHPQNPKKPFLGTYNGKPKGNTYSHNCMMHIDTMLKFGALFDLAKYFFEHT